MWYLARSDQDRLLERRPADPDGCRIAGHGRRRGAPAKGGSGYLGGIGQLGLGRAWRDRVKLLRRRQVLGPA